MAIDRPLAGLLLFALSIGAGCGTEGADLAGGASNAPGTGPSAGGASSDGSSAPMVNTTPGSASLPPEKELDQSFRAPVASAKVLWSANPVSGRVALIDPQTLAVRITNAGFGPTYLAAVPSDLGDSAIVINVGSHDATWFVAGPDTIDALNIPTHVGANAWSISPGGRFAIAWTDASRIEGGASDSVNGYSELTVIDLAPSPPQSTRLSVGFRPSQIAFDAASRHAFAVVDEGITVLDLGAHPALSRLLTVSDDGRAGHARDVNIAPDGSFAAVRVPGSPNVEVIDLASNERQIVTLESNVTDLDLSADGKTASAVLGDALPPRVVRFTVPKAGADPAIESRAIDGELVRSVTLTPDDQVALLYANAVPSSHLTLLDQTSLEFRSLDLQGAVQK